MDNGAGPTVSTPSGDALTGALLEIKGNISGVGSLTKQGYDAVVLSGTNTYTGGTFVNTGWLRAGAANTLPTAGLLSTTGGGVFDLNGYNVEVGTLTSPGALVGTTAQQNSNGYITNTAPFVSTLTVGNGTSADFTYAGLVQYNVGLDKIGANVLSLLNSNTYVGPTTINAGDVRAVDGVGLPTASNLVISGNDPLNAAAYEPTTSTFTRSLGSGAGQVQITGGSSGFGAFGTPLTVDVGGNGTGTGPTLQWGTTFFNPSTFLLNDSHATAASTLTNNIDLNPTTSVVTRGIAVNSTGANTATIKGNLLQSGSGAATLDKTGPGTLILSSTSTLSYTGGTTVDNGTLQAGATNQLPQTLLSVNSTGSTTGTFDMKGFSQNVGGLAGTGANALVTSTGGPATLIVGSDNTDHVFNGKIMDGTGSTGVVTFTKQGTGTQTLAGPSAYSGNTTVNGGTLLVSGSLNGTALVNVNNGGTLAGGGSITTSNNGSVTLALGASLAPTTDSTFSLNLGTGSLDLSAAVAPSNSQSLIFAMDPAVTSAMVAVNTGTLSIGTGVLEFNDFNFSAAGGFGTGNTYTLFHSTNAINGTLGANLTGQINGFVANIAIQGDDVVLQVVPEPNSMVMLLGSIGMALGLQRFRRRRSAKA
ncbi:autotransporter-associated beta strand repeat protein [Chthoniobacter flavus Ellin428]|uniref:Autotransporter-associated beta strand repeat protein n=1 Tax=Chthoniobacter flavus Ellin428 TaxID=497964 RepID=B4CYP3_9BACT|nr:autotransporter-associated beta strand repeat-containing protein [Chthoniobacter flavus]EDY20584.1 autotransporter-associated beta strand repeat protein [Chthoniobacter flavus Ellin428]